ncbi:sugar transferase [Acuticoccus kandeliae]|uniref:sugar transferase n=1 Tax=Acuticoccus kandeliae TaxID=2073160 RepID=UPI000D3E036F|nr:sugar transferase [Acuticoccus kandeliae]
MGRPIHATDIAGAAIVESGVALDPARDLPAAGEGRAAYWRAKRVFDVVLAAALLPFVALQAVFVLALNIGFNPGPLFFAQARMGAGCRPFTLYKFRTMREGTGARGPEDPIERERITAFGRVLRATRLDETPQLLNVLRGEMSLIGPRPDMYEHAAIYARTVPHYPERHVIRPGLTGLAQVRLGYAEGSVATAEKVRMDLAYVRTAGWRLDAAILSATVRVVLTAGRAR